LISSCVFALSKPNSPCACSTGSQHEASTSHKLGRQAGAHCQLGIHGTRILRVAACTACRYTPQLCVCAGKHSHLRLQVEVSWHRCFPPQ
jgi:hypothetical protein